MSYNLIHGDCLAIMPDIVTSSVDLIACDLPYQSTQCRWDTRVPLDPLWHEYQRILKPDGAVVLTADFRFAMSLVESSPKGWFRHELVWDRVRVSGFLDANRRPMRRHEFVLVFGPKAVTYHPQMVKGGKPYSMARNGTANIYSDHKRVSTESANGDRFPSSILPIQNHIPPKQRIHNTEKPVELMAWLIRTYSDPGDVVLDNAFGSCSTGLAAIQEGRQFIGIELDPVYYEAGKARLQGSNPESSGHPHGHPVADPSIQDMTPGYRAATPKALAIHTGTPLPIPRYRT